jgi:hypothetical protein
MLDPEELDPEVLGPCVFEACGGGLIQMHEEEMKKNGPHIV